MELNRRKLHLVVVAIAVWLCAVVAVLHHGHRQHAINNQIEELVISIGGLQSKLYLPVQQRVKLLDEIDLERQLLQAQTLQLKSEPPVWMGLDTTHTVYLLERYMDQLSLLLADEVRFDTFIKSITAQPAALSSEAMRLDGELATVVLGTLYSDGEYPRQVYLKLEHIQHQAFLLPAEEQVRLLQQVAQASSILSQLSKTNFLVDRTINHPVYNELNQQIKQSHSLFKQQIWIIILLSGLVFIVLSMLAVNTNNQIKNRESQNQSGSLVESVEIGPQASPDELILQDVEMSEELVRQKLIEHNQELVAISEEIEQESNLNPQSEVEQQSSESNSVTKQKIDFARMLHTLDNDQTSMLLLLNVFISEHSQDIPYFRQALQQDKEKATRVVHTLKGVSGTIFADELRAVAIELENALRAGDSVDESQIIKLEHELNSALELVHNYISQHSDGTL